MGFCVRLDHNTTALVSYSHLSTCIISCTAIVPVPSCCVLHLHVHATCACQHMSPASTGVCAGIHMGACGRHVPAEGHVKFRPSDRLLLVGLEQCLCVESFAAVFVSWLYVCDAYVFCSGTQGPSGQWRKLSCLHLLGVGAHNGSAVARVADTQPLAWRMLLVVHSMVCLRLTVRRQQASTVCQQCVSCG
jgi:hypothetical protein